MQSLGIDQEGLALSLANDNCISSLACIMEFLDNSLKAKSDNIYIIDEDNIFCIRDNGKGFNKNKIKGILTQFKRHGEENKNSLSHFGIGMKASLYCKLKKSNNNFGFIISVTETSRGPQPTIIYLKYINNIIKYNSIELPLSLSQKLIEFIDKGTIIYLEKESDILFDSDNPDEEIILDYLEKFIDNNVFNNSFIEDKDNLYEDLCKLYAPVLKDKLNITFNNKKCEPIYFIKETDQLVFNLDIYIKITDTEHILLLKDYNFQYSLDGKFREKYNNIENYDFDNDLNIIKLGNLEFYNDPTPRPSGKLKRVQINIPGNRIIQRNNFPKNINGIREHTHYHMRLILNVTNLNYMKENLLVQQKLPNNHMSVTDLVNKYEGLTRAVVKICINDTILENNGWYIYKDGGKTHKHMKLSDKPEPEPEPEPSTELEFDQSSPISDINSESSSSDNESKPKLNPKRKQKNRGATLKPGGYLYLLTLKDSLDWKTPDGKTIYKFGKATNLKERIKQHQHNHPTKEIDVIYNVKTEFNLDQKETEIITKLQENNYLYNTNSTSTTEFICSDNIIEVISIINSVVPDN